MDYNRLQLIIMDFFDIIKIRIINHFKWILINYFCIFKDTDYKKNIIYYYPQNSSAGYLKVTLM